MKKFFDHLNKTSTTSFIAILWTVAAIVFLFYIASGWAKAHDTIQTQCIQGLFGIVMLVAGYYFGSSRKHQGTNDTEQLN